MRDGIWKEIEKQIENAITFCQEWAQKLIEKDPDDAIRETQL